MLLAIAAALLVYGWPRIVVTTSFVRMMIPFLLAAKERVHDKAHFFMREDKLNIETVLCSLFVETNMDVHLAIFPDLEGRSPEEVATTMFEELRIGGQSHRERGLLVLVDLGGQRFRLQAGYDLEEYFPDSFLSYMIHDHARHFFAAKNPSRALSATVKILTYHIRRAILEGRFATAPAVGNGTMTFLSSGGGASGVVPVAGDAKSLDVSRLPESARESLVAAPTVEEAFRRYLAWTALGVPDPEIGLFPHNTQTYLTTMPLTPVWLDFLRLRDGGHHFEIDERGDYALLYFTDDPLAEPEFFHRAEAGWQLDMVENALWVNDVVGRSRAWCYVPNETPYDKLFADRFFNDDNCVRVRGADNRPIERRSQR
ncbi:MAG TPA: hypothetical protein DEP35_06405 [Deltaproteobacteria bacterium]|jgi:hypothetical protein|nr:hypothetical protein [Deltaproteobacteria bacterium]